MCFILTTGVSPSSPDSILAQSSSQHRFSSAVATRAAQRAKARYRSDQERSKDFKVGLSKRGKVEKYQYLCTEKILICFYFIVIYFGFFSVKTQGILSGFKSMVQIGIVQNPALGAQRFYLKKLFGMNLIHLLLPVEIPEWGKCGILAAAKHCTQH